MCSLKRVRCWVTLTISSATLVGPFGLVPEMGMKHKEWKNEIKKLSTKVKVKGHLHSPVLRLRQVLHLTSALTSSP